MVIKPRQRGREKWEAEADLNLREQQHQHKMEASRFYPGALLLLFVIVSAVTTQQQWLPSVIAGSYASLIAAVFTPQETGRPMIPPKWSERPET